MYMAWGNTIILLWFWLSWQPFPWFPWLPKCTFQKTPGRSTMAIAVVECSISAEPQDHQHTRTVVTIFRSPLVLEIFENMWKFEWLLWKQNQTNQFYLVHKLKLKIVTTFLVCWWSCGSADMLHSATPIAIMWHFGPFWKVHFGNHGNKKCPWKWLPWQPKS